MHALELSRIQLEAACTLPGTKQLKAPIAHALCRILKINLSTREIEYICASVGSVLLVIVYGNEFYLSGSKLNSALAPGMKFKLAPLLNY